MKKLLIAASVVLGMGLSGVAAAATFDFDAETNERGGQPLAFSSGGINLLVFGYQGSYTSQADKSFAYLDTGRKSGLGVCGKVYRPGRLGDTASGDDFAGSVNECNPDNDDNMKDSKKEWLAFTRVDRNNEQKDFRVDGFSLWGDHVDYGSDKVWVTVDGSTWSAVSVVGGYADLGGVHVSRLGIHADQGMQAYVGRLDVSEVPVPGTLGLLGLGLAGLGAVRRKKA